MPESNIKNQPFKRIVEFQDDVFPGWMVDHPELKDEIVELSDLIFNMSVHMKVVLVAILRHKGMFGVWHPTPLEKRYLDQALPYVDLEPTLELGTRVQVNGTRQDFRGRVGVIHQIQYQPEHRDRGGLGGTSDGYEYGVLTETGKEMIGFDVKDLIVLAPFVEDMRVEDRATGLKGTVLFVDIPERDNNVLVAWDDKSRYFVNSLSIRALPPPAKIEPPPPKQDAG